MALAIANNTTNCLGRNMAQIKVLNGKSADLSLDLPVGEALEIGTKRQAFLRLRDAGVSYIHAQLRFDGTDLKIQDCRSQTGTFLGEAAVGAEAVKVTPESIFRVGKTQIQFLATAALEPKAPSVDHQAHEQLKAKLEKLHEELSRVKNQNETLSLERDELKTTLDEVRNQLQDAEDIASDTLEAANQHEAKNRDLKDEVENLRSKLKEQRQQTESEAELKQTIESQNSELKSREARIVELQQQLSEQESALKSQQAHIEKLDLTLVETAREAIMTELRNQELTGRGCDLIEELEAQEQAQLSAGILSLFREHAINAEESAETLAPLESEVERLKAEQP